MAILVDQNQIHKTCPAGTGKKHHRFLMQLEGPVLDQLLHLCGSVSLEEFGNAYRGITRFSVDQWAQILSLLTQIKEQFTLISSRTTPGNKQDTTTANRFDPSVYRSASPSPDPDQKDAGRGRLEGKPSKQSGPYRYVSAGT